MFSYPLQVHPCRASVDAVLKWRPKSAHKSSSDESPHRSVPLLGPSTNGTNKIRGDSMSETRFAAITTAIIVLSYIVAMTISSLEAVLAYVGATGSTSISFILPGLFYYKISDPESPHHQRLLKEDDDGEDDDDQEEGEGLLGQRQSRWTHWSTTGKGRRKLLRRLSLALAVYGIVVMITCLVVNTYFVASH